MIGATTCSVVIPTLGREQVLVDTIGLLLAQSAIGEIIVIDQTPQHLPGVDAQLRSWDREGRIRWLRQQRPSIPAAMNRGLLAAQCEVVLFLDDDVIPGEDLAALHLAGHGTSGAGLVAGQVLQPWEPSPSPLVQGEEFRFSSTVDAEIGGFMAGNCSIRRTAALRVGGFDENFVGAAYRFENDFASRWLAAGERIWFAPQASIRHLRAPSGGTRAFGAYLETARPHHSVGEYYFALRTQRVLPATRTVLRRLFRSLVNRHHLQRPWWLLPTLVAEVSGLAWAVGLAVQGPRLLTTIDGAVQ